MFNIMNFTEKIQSMQFHGNKSMDFRTCPIAYKQTL